MMRSEAETRHNGSIKPCSGLPWDDCYQTYGHFAVFYYNDPRDNTHAICADIRTHTLVTKIHFEAE
jgi:hypothetical protein